MRRFAVAALLLARIATGVHDVIPAPSPASWDVTADRSSPDRPRARSPAVGPCCRILRPGTAG